MTFLAAMLVLGGSTFTLLCTLLYLLSRKVAELEAHAAMQANQIKYLSLRVGETSWEVTRLGRIARIPVEEAEFLSYQDVGPKAAAKIARLRAIAQESH